MDADEIRTLLGEMVFERAQKYRRRILQSSCTTNEDGVRHVSALVQGNGADCFYTQVWLRENGSFVSASCDCPYNQLLTYLGNDCIGPMLEGGKLWYEYLPVLFLFSRASREISKVACRERYSICALLRGHILLLRTHWSCFR